MRNDIDEYGYLLAHFREDRVGHAEKIYFSLSQGDSPLRWDPLWGGQAVLESAIGTTGVRDPAIVRDDDGRFHILATDLRVWDGGGLRWDEWSRHGSRSLIVWDSDDLESWDGPRSVEIAPANAGMAWAPEVTTDPATGDRIVFWSSRLFADDDPGHEADSYSRIMYSRTRDFRTFTPGRGDDRYRWSRHHRHRPHPRERSRLPVLQGRGALQRVGHLPRARRAACSLATSRSLPPTLPATVTPEVSRRRW